MVDRSWEGDRSLTPRSRNQTGKRISPQRHRDTEEHLRKTTDSQVDVGASSLGFESTEETEATENGKTRWIRGEFVLFSERS
jgi:hypothetical protein